MSDEILDSEQATLDDAIIEDTCHCTVCQAAFVLGDNEPYVILDPPGDQQEAYERGCQQIKLCPECALRVCEQVRAEMAEGACCEHGIADGEYCRACNREYKRAARENGFE
ncbi:MAG: hypothetical protein PHU85_02015 [Phycisphaerae bacterium]|nr:hypothetical protein [Phycisphaerae bacterium]